MNEATMECATLSDDAMDLLTELFNIGAGRAAASLSELLESRIELTVPSIRIGHCEWGDDSPYAENPAASTTILQEFNGGVSGRAALVFPEHSGLALAQLLTDPTGAATEFDTELAGVLLEVGNIVLNGVVGSLANLVRSGLEYSVPELVLSGNLGAVRTTAVIQTNETLYANVHFRVCDREISGWIVIVFSLGSINQLLESAAANG